MDIERLVKLSARAWCLPILAALDRGVAARQAPLLRETGAGRTALAQSLTHLIELGMIERNPGHGHPLRPEYRLTPEGLGTAAMAGRIAAVAPAAPLLRRAWTVPVLALTTEPRRFGELKTGLPRITDRALSQSLMHLEERAWLRRDIDTAHRMPRPLYLATGTGLKISEAVRVG